MYWFAAQQQTSTLRHQKYARFYSKFNVQSGELTSSFPKLKEVAQNVKKNKQ